MVIEVLDIGLKRPAIRPPPILMTMVFIMMEVLEYMWVTEDLDLGFKGPSTIPIEIAEFIIMVTKVVKMEEVDIGLKRPDTITL